MLSKRQAAQLGLLSAAVVFVACLGILFTRASDQTAAPEDQTPSVVQTTNVDSSHVGISLSAQDSAHTTPDQH